MAQLQVVVAAIASATLVVLIGRRFWAGGILLAAGLAFIFADKAQLQAQMATFEEQVARMDKELASLAELAAISHQLSSAFSELLVVPVSESITSADAEDAAVVAGPRKRVRRTPPPR